MPISRPRTKSPAPRLNFRATMAMAALVCGASTNVRSQADFNDPKVVAAQLEMQTLAEAEMACSLDTTYFVSLESLNDLPTPTTPSYDYIDADGAARVLDTNTGSFTPTPVNLLQPFPLPHWGGPYVNYQNGQTQLSPNGYEIGTPLDPWGNPYYFFSPVGLVRGNVGSVTFEMYGDYFDRWAIVSLGPNGVLDGGPGGAFPGGDDLVYEFGGGVSASVLSSLQAPGPGLFAASGGAAGAKTATGKTTSSQPAAARPAVAAIAAAPIRPLDVNALPDGSGFTASEGDAVVIRGYNLGGLQGASHVLFGSLELTDVRQWSDRAVIVVLPPGLLGSDKIYVKLNGFPTNGLPLSIRPGHVNAARGWELYN